MHRFALPIAAYLTAACLAFGAATKAPTNDDCMDCHGDKELTKTNEVGKVLSMFTDVPLMKGTAHDGLDCVECHADIKDVPHEGAIARVQCGACHEDETKAHKASLHGRRLEQGHEAAACADCHGHAHTIPANDSTNSAVYATHVPDACGRCHDQSTDPVSGKASASALKTYQHSVHGQRVKKDGKPAATCFDCHGAHNVKPINDPTAPLYWQNVPNLCGKCHEDVVKEFWRSVHGKGVKAGKRDSPICTDCHGEHEMKSLKQDEIIKDAAHIPETCAQCHGAMRIASKYSLSKNVVDTYMDSFHGLANQMGGVSAANCASCHGYHNILPSSDAGAMTHKDNLPKTCGKCHQGIGTRLALGDLRIHAPPGAADGKAPVVNFVARAYFWIIVFVIGGMLFYNLVDYAAQVRARIRAVRASPDAEVRMTPLLRAQHATLMILFIVLAYTGFVHKYPDALFSLPFKWMESGNEFRGLAHRVSGWAFTILFAIHLIALIGTKAGRGYMFALRLRPHDMTDAIRRFRRNIGLTSGPIPHRRFNFAEKSEYWALVWGSVVMIITGVMLIYTDRVLRLWPQVWHELAQVVHYYEAVLATLAIVVWHLYWVLFEGHEYPMNTGWLIGKRLRHPSDKGSHHGHAKPAATPSENTPKP